MNTQLSLLRIRISHVLLTIMMPVACAGAFALSAQPCRAETSGYFPGGSLTDPRSSHTATLLPDGRILVVGGFQSQRRRLVALQSAELYDSTTRTWSATGNLLQAREKATATLLPNGQVLLAGGAGEVQSLSCELYNPVTGVWSATGSLNAEHIEATATLLP